VNRLKSAGCEVTDVVDHDFIRSIYFTDPNGIASRRRGGRSTPPAALPTTETTGCSRTPNPVPAVSEIRDRGHVASAPHTRLS